MLTVDEALKLKPNSLSQNGIKQKRSCNRNATIATRTISNGRMLKMYVEVEKTSPNPKMFAQS